MIRFILLCLVLSIFEISCAPIEYPFQVIPLHFLPPGPSAPFPPPGNPKVSWNFVGDILTNTGFLPIEINVPDTVTGITSGAQNLVQGIATAAGSLFQRIPFITRLTSPERPRPFRFLVVDQSGQVVGMMPGY